MKNRITIETKKKKRYSIFLLTVLFLKNALVFATPGGPTQPEAESFKPIGVSDHVNHFNGAFSYTIPLLDVDGFPINLNYTGNPSLESDASWVGLGWDLNLGAVNRQMRGLPDEFNGMDTMEKTYKVRDNTTYGVKFNFNIQLANFEKLKRSLSLGLGYGIYFNNYRGMKTEISVTPSFNSSKEISDDKTIGKTGLGAKINPSLGINSSSESGLSLTPNIGLSMVMKEKDKKERSLGGVNLGVPMSAREGIKGLNYGFNVNYKLSRSVKDENGNVKKSFKYDGKYSGGGSLSFVGPSTPPFVQNPMENESYALTLNGGGDAWTVDFGVGAMGNYCRNYVSQQIVRRPLFGYFNLEKGTNSPDGVLDFEREKDIPYQQNIPIIGIPQANYDLFSVNQPTNSTQFRAFRTTSGIFKDPVVTNNTVSHDLGGEVHGGSIFEAGGTLTENFGGTTSGKWVNSFTGTGDFQNYDFTTSPLKESYIIKSQNESTPTNDELYTKLGYEKPISIAAAGASSGFIDKGGSPIIFPRVPIEPDYSNAVNTKKFTRTTLFSFLNTAERKGVGLDKQLYNYNTEPKSDMFASPNASRYKPNHISEITITNPDGSRAVYGLPLYNIFSREVNFSMPYQSSGFGTGMIGYTSTDASTDNGNGTEALYSSERTPEYPHTWLMTGLLSPDYADLHGDGITDDDRGSAHKINYSLKNPNYVWRMPAHSSAMMATYNPGLESDLKDDKASFSEGSREEWYVHSVESKNKIALFILEPRQDAYGSVENTGGKNTGSVKYRIKQIKLYSKADWYKNPSTAELIKAVNFEYDYSSCKGVPNADNGKLTLKKIYFTYGSSSRSQLNSYQFEYNNDAYYDYTAKAMDRWGNFKKNADNPNGLQNHDFPYSTQDKVKADKNAAAWLIKKITLPSGGEIAIDYESHTYAFVQNKRASYMTPILGVGATEDGIDKFLYKPVGSGIGGTIYQNYNYLFFEFDKNAIPTSVEEMKNLYFNDDQNLNYSKHVYFRTKVNLTKRNGQMLKEYIPGYAEIESMGIHKTNPNVGWIKLKEVEGEQCIAFYSWQFLKSNNPKLAYPYNDANYTDALQAVLGMASFMGNIREMLEGYAHVAQGYAIAQTIEPTESYIRVLKPDMMKYGGGARVSKIQISDNWSAMSGSGKTSTYGQIYKYETEYNGKTISSGVAEYEPLLGNDENSLKKPILYAGAKGLLAPTSIYYVDEPIGENFYPSPSVGYSKVSVRSIHSDPNKISGSGHQEYEFYTAKDFPVKTDKTNTGDNISTSNPPFFASFLKVFNHSSVWVSQGFSVEVNDMHGKPKSDKTYNHKGSIIAQTNYKYWVDDENKVYPNLVNELPTIDVNNNVQNTLMGVNFDFYNDMRQSITKSTEFALELGGGMFPLGFLPGFFIVPLSTFGVTSEEYKSAATMKYIHKKGFLRRTEKYQDGSKITTENKLWDRNTGDVLLTTVQNEFDQPIYNVKMPAYWRYDGMGFAYKNRGTSFFVKLDNTTRKITDWNTNSNMHNILYPGDEVEYLQFLPFDLTNPHKYKKYWVVKNFATNELSLIDQYGDKIFDNTPNPFNFPIIGKINIVRSGRRNLVSAPMFSATMLDNPMYKGTSIEVEQTRRILNASTQTYSDDWRIVSNYKEKVNDSCCNEEKWYAKINKLYSDNKSTISNWLCPPIIPAARPIENEDESSSDYDNTEIKMEGYPDREFSIRDIPITDEEREKFRKNSTLTEEEYQQIENEIEKNRKLK